MIIYDFEDFLEAMIEGGLLIPGIIVSIFIAAQGVFIFLKWFKVKESFLDKDNLPILVTSIGFFLGAITLLLSTILIEGSILANIYGLPINLGLALFVFMGLISAGIILAGMVWEFIITKSTEKEI
ncbi:MAG: hypothetical protein GF329_15475 [Candidatus Lokiarchaeota archaeon]|nr:hypothetical protein [Candidatus Lokiarchaeota archaeon]